MSNRFEKLKYTPNSESEITTEQTEQYDKSITETHGSNSGVSLSINANENTEKKVASNYTLYPSQKKKLSELATLFHKSGSTILGEVIDQLHEEYLNK